MRTGAAAFAEVQPHIEAVRDDPRLLELHVPSVALAIRLSAPQIEDVVARERDLPRAFDVSAVTRLRTYAAAAWHAYARSLPVNESLVDDLTREALATREELTLYARAFSCNGWVREADLPPLRRRPSPRVLARDVLALVEVMGGVLPRLQLVGIQSWQLARAAAVALDLWIASTQPGHAPEPDAGEACTGACSILVSAYSDCRAVVRWVRAEHGDFDDVAPSLGLDEPYGEDGDAFVSARSVGFETH